MLGQVTNPGAGFQQPSLPAGRERAETPRDKARRRLRSRIGREAAALFEGDGREQPFQGGEFLARREDAGENVFIVLDGIVGLYHELPTGDRDVLGYCCSGDLVAPARLGEAWGFDVKALTGGRLLALSLRAVRSRDAGEQDLAWPLFEVACGELARRTARLRGYWLLPVKARLATFLFEMDEAIGERSEQGLVLRLPMFRDEIASYLGTRTETICRILTGWKDKGLIVMESPRVLVIPDDAPMRSMRLPDSPTASGFRASPDRSADRD